MWLVITVVCENDHPVCNSNKVLPRWQQNDTPPIPAMAVQRGISFKRFAESKVINGFKLLEHPTDELTEWRMYGKQNELFFNYHLSLTQSAILHHWWPFAAVVHCMVITLKLHQRCPTGGPWAASGRQPCQSRPRVPVGIGNRHNYPSLPWRIRRIYHDRVIQSYVWEFTYYIRQVNGVNRGDILWCLILSVRSL